MPSDKCYREKKAKKEESVYGIAEKRLAVLILLDKVIFDKNWKRMRKQCMQFSRNRVLYQRNEAEGSEAGVCLGVQGLSRYI
jgi:hypothetical protein